MLTRFSRACFFTHWIAYRHHARGAFATLFSGRSKLCCARLLCSDKLASSVAASRIWLCSTVTVSCGSVAEATTMGEAVLAYFQQSAANSAANCRFTEEQNLGYFSLNFAMNSSVSSFSLRPRIPSRLIFAYAFMNFWFTSTS